MIIYPWKFYIYILCSVRVLNELGKRSAKAAKFSIVVTVLTSLAIRSFLFLFLFFLFFLRKDLLIYLPQIKRWPQLSGIVLGNVIHWQVKVGFYHPSSCFQIALILSTDTRHDIYMLATVLIWKILNSWM